MDEEQDPPRKPFSDYSHYPGKTILMRNNIFGTQYETNIYSVEFITLYTWKYSAIADRCSLVNLEGKTFSIIKELFFEFIIRDLYACNVTTTQVFTCLYLLALESQTQQWTPRRPLNTHRIWLKPKSSIYKTMTVYYNLDHINYQHLPWQKDIVVDHTAFELWWLGQ